MKEQLIKKERERRSNESWFRKNYREGFLSWVRFKSLVTFLIEINPLNFFSFEPGLMGIVQKNQRGIRIQSRP